MVRYSESSPDYTGGGLSMWDEEGGPRTRESIAQELQSVGLDPGMRSGGAGGRSLRDIRTLREAGVPEPRLMSGAIPIGPGGIVAAAGRYLPQIATGAAALYAGAQALGLGEGEGLFGTDAFPGDGGQQIEPGGVPFVGPGLREPSAEYVVKEWRRRVDSRDGDYNLQFYLVKMPGRAYRIYMYSQRTRGWKSWSMPRPAVIGKNMPSHKMLTRLRRNLKKQAADAKTILQVASPTAYAKQLGYRKPRTHRHR